MLAIETYRESAALKPLTIPVRSISARPEMTASIERETGLDETLIRAVVEDFYARVRRDPLLGPIFAARVTDWPAHLDRLCDFWSSVALMTGRYHGQPVPQHQSLPIDHDHFTHWLALFSATVHDHCQPAAAAHLLERAQRIAQSLERAMPQNQRQQDSAASA